MNYSPDNFEPYINPEVEVIKRRNQENENKKDQEALSRLDPLFLLSDFKHLPLKHLPRNWDTYFQHNTKKLYIKRTGHLYNYEYTNVTDDYDWEQVIICFDVPFSRYKKI